MADAETTMVGPTTRPSEKSGLLPERRRGAPALHPLERALLVVAALNLCVLPWALGGMRPAGQWIAGALSIAAFVLALWPRRYPDPQRSARPITLRLGRGLLRSPFFWAGALLLSCIVIAGFNPAWSFVTDGRTWTLRPEFDVGWLPHGVTDAPFRMMNPWRMLLICGSAWLLACSLWVGLTRARSIRILLTVLVVNGTLLSLLAFIQRAVGVKEILGFIPVHQNAWSFVSTFVYKNHGGAYFNLIAAIAFALALYHAVRGRRHLLKSSPALLFVLLGLTNSATVFISYSRMALLLWGLMVLVVFGVYLALMWRRRVGFSPVSAVLAIVCLLSTALWLKAGVVRLDFASSSLQRLGEGRSESSVAGRLVAYEATWEMARDRLWLGHGAGSFRFVFPRYQMRHPELLDQHGRMAGFWDHTHNDYLEFLAEFGIVGAVLALLGLAAFVVALARAGTWRHGPNLVLLAAVVLLFVHAAVDFPLQNPAIVCTAIALAVACLKWVDRQNGVQLSVTPAGEMSRRSTRRPARR